MELTILLPCLNEAETIEVCVNKARGWIQKAGIQGEVLISDNGSTDGSQEIAEKAGARVVHAPRRGYGAALIQGIESAQGRFIIMGDADDSYDFSRLDLFWEKLNDGYDLVMGNRFQGGIEPGAMPWLHRYLGNPVLSFLGRLFFRTDCGDFHCGLRGFRRQAIKDLKMVTPGMEFASEMVVKASLMGLKIGEVPTKLSPDGRSRAPHLNTWRDGWRHLRFLLVFSPRWLYLIPGLFLIGLGLIIWIWLLPGPGKFLGLELGVHTLLMGSLFVTIGLQCVMFSILAKTYAIRYGLHPPHASLARLEKLLPFENWTFIGGVVVAGGSLLTLVAIASWAIAGFGPLDPERTLRWLIPGVTLVSLGFEIILFSFFFWLIDFGFNQRKG
ncbi:MAG: glycosyltransferase [Verrucomicrobiota bacterium]